MAIIASTPEIPCQIGLANTFRIRPSCLVPPVVGFLEVSSAEGVLLRGARVWGPETDPGFCGLSDRAPPGLEGGDRLPLRFGGVIKGILLLWVGVFVVDNLSLCTPAQLIMYPPGLPPCWLFVMGPGSRWMQSTRAFTPP